MKHGRLRFFHNMAVAKSNLKSLATDSSVWKKRTGVILILPVVENLARLTF